MDEVDRRKGITVHIISRKRRAMNIKQVAKTKYMSRLLDVFLGDGGEDDDGGHVATHLAAPLTSPGERGVLRRGS